MSNKSIFIDIEETMELQPDYKVTLWGIPAYMIDDPGETYLWATHWTLEVPLMIVRILHQLAGADYSVVVKENYRRTIKVEREDDE
jgi:hypothetical protein